MRLNSKRTLPLFAYEKSKCEFCLLLWKLYWSIYKSYSDIEIFVILVIVIFCLLLLFLMMLSPQIGHPLVCIKMLIKYDDVTTVHLLAIFWSWSSRLGR